MAAGEKESRLRANIEIMTHGARAKKGVCAPQGGERGNARTWLQIGVIHFIFFCSKSF